LARTRLSRLTEKPADPSGVLTHGAKAAREKAGRHCAALC
jgi:hypothetical protein